MSVVTVSTEQARKEVRAEHDVRLVTLKEEGSAFRDLPNGVYGFTYAPATETPVFERHSYHSFEVHKLPDGSGQIFGYCTAEDAAKVQARSEMFEITLYPDTWANATEMVCIPFSWLLTDIYKPVRREGNATPLRLSAG